LISAMEAPDPMMMPIVVAIADHAHEVTVHGI
jgi:hypothetical protein